MKAEISGIIAQVTREMIGKVAIFPANKKDLKELQTIPKGKKIFNVISYGGKHNLERHDLFYACVAIVAENLGKAASEVVETCKIDCRWYKGFTHYVDKKGNTRVNIITKSIKFSEMTLKEADDFYRMAFDTIAGYIKVDTAQLVQEAKSRMGL